MADVRFTVLGPLSVTVDGEPVPVAGRRERAVLATLLAADGEPVPADRLIEEVWGPAPTAAAVNSLHVAVSRLRSLLEPERAARSTSGVLVTSARGYAVATGPGAVDAHRVTVLVAEAGAELAAGRAERAAALAGQAAALWTGPPYAGTSAGDLLAAEVSRLEDLRLSAAELLADARLATGRAAEVVADLEPLRVRHPFRERLWQLSALALYRCDRQVDALALLRSLRTRLAEDLGVDASPATRELEAAILRQDAALGGAGLRVTPVPAPPDGGGRPPLVGRDAEFGRLRALVAEAASTGARFALVEGEPGIGKTRLLEELADHAGRTGATVVWARCDEGGLAPAYWPWMQVVRGLPVAAAGDPALAALVDPRAGGGGLTEERRFALFEALAGLLATAAGTAPLVLLLEDLHWADPASAEALAHLATRLHDEPVAVVATRREPELGGDDPAAAAVAALSRRTGTRRLVLRGLTPAAASSLVTTVVQHPVRDDVAGAVHARAEGNPFFIAELSRLLDSEHGLSDVAAVQGAGIPAGVRDVVRRRLSALPEGTRAVLEVAAVVGRENDLRVVVAAGDLSPEACLDALEPALRSRVLVPVPGTPGRHRFAHALVHEVALADVAPLRLARTHARVADVLLETGDDEDAEAAAGHLWAAGAVVDPARAARALETAAVHALRRTAYESADDLLERALTLWRGARARTADTDEAELSATLRLARLRRARRGYRRTATSVPLDRADALARRTGRLDLLVGLLHIRWGDLTTACDIPAAEAAAGEMRALAGDTADRLVQLVGRTAWGVQCWQLGRVREAADELAAVLELQESLDAVDRGRLAEYGHSLTAPWATFVLELAGRLDDGEQRFERLAAAYPEPYARVVVAHFSALVGVCTGDVDRAARWAARARADDRAGGFSFVGAACQVIAGWAGALAGDPGAGLALLEDGLRGFRATGARTMLGLMTAMRVDALLAAGRPPASVREVLRADTAEVVASGERACLPFLDVARARVVAAEGGDPRPYLRRASEEADRMGLAVLGRTRDPAH